MGRKPLPAAKTSILGIRLTDGDYAALAQAAAADQRSMSSLAGKVLGEWLRANGYAPAPAKTAVPQRERARAKATAARGKAAPAALRRLARRSA
jgi:hypothetical protein